MIWSFLHDSFTLGTALFSTFSYVFNLYGLIIVAAAVETIFHFFLDWVCTIVCRTTKLLNVHTYWYIYVCIYICINAYLYLYLYIYIYMKVPNALLSFSFSSDVNPHSFSLSLSPCISLSHHLCFASFFFLLNCLDFVLEREHETRKKLHNIFENRK